VPIACAQVRCRYCYLEDGVKICTTDPVFIHPAESRVFILKCNTYLKRLPGDKLGPWSPKDPDGFYPGQLRPPLDLSDFDAEDDTPVELDGKDCKT